MKETTSPYPGRPSPRHPDVPFDVLAFRLSEELAALSRLAEDLQIVTNRVGQSSNLTSADSKAFQTLDRLTQTLHDLARVMRHISEAGSGNHIEARALTDMLTLMDLRDRLLAGKGHINKKNASGIVSLF